MKLPIAIITLIFAAAAALGWHQQLALNQLRADEQALIANAIGLTGGSMAGGDSRTPGPRKSRAEREAEARTVAAKLIASLNEVGTQAPGEPYAEVEKRVEKLLRPISEMNSLQLRVMIEEFRNCPHFENPVFLRNGSIGVAIEALADTDPQAAMTLLTEKGGQLSDLMFEGYDRVIGRWASTDPLAAFAWMRENRAKINKGGEGGKAVVIGLAAKDPKLAVQAMVEFGTYELHGDGE